jgi:isochorismate synthase
MIDWRRVEYLLATLTDTAQPARLLGVTQPLAHWPAANLPLTGDWCFWQRPERGLRLLGFGKALVATSAGSGRFAALHAAQRGLAGGWHHAQDGDAPAPLAFTGFAFSPQDDSDGGALPNASLWVPEVLLREAHGKVWLTLTCAAIHAHEAPARWRTFMLSAQSKHAVSPAPSFSTCLNPLEDQAFIARGHAALRAIAAGQADKLVLTRTQRLEADTPISVDAVLATLDTLAARYPTCATFGVGHSSQAFIGASPETLLALNGATVAVDALAGTAWQSSALTLDADKNRREHDFVARAVRAALAETCHDIALPDAPEVMQLNALTHLRRRVLARRPDTVSAFDLIARLHPTPAVGGAPTVTALDWLADHHDRRGAWYTGGIGWIDAGGDCDITVALRCGLIEDKAVTLYAGAGFVAGSDPEQELAETEAKFSAMREALVTSAASLPRTQQDAA